MTSEANKKTYSRNIARRKFIKHYSHLIELTNKDVIHHRDFNPFNNDIDNLSVVGQATHKLIHHRERRKVLLRFLCWHLICKTL
jgi:hypothetical protein